LVGVNILFRSDIICICLVVSLGK